MKTTYNYEGTVAANLVEDKDIVNDLTTGGTNKVLSAEQGKVLKGLVDASQPEGFDQLVSDVAQAQEDISQAQTDIQSVKQKNTQQDTSIASLQAKLEKALFLENPNA